MIVKGDYGGVSLGPATLSGKNTHTHTRTSECYRNINKKDYMSSPGRAAKDCGSDTTNDEPGMKAEKKSLVLVSP